MLVGLNIFSLLLKTHHALDVVPKAEPVFMRASQTARIGQEKPHETQAPHSRADLIRKLRSAEQLLNQRQS